MVRVPSGQFIDTDRRLFLGPVGFCM